MLVSLLIIAFSSFAPAQEKTLTPELILTLRNITDVQLSPDGKNIAFQISRPRRDDEGPGAAISEIWMMPSSGGQPARFTFNDRSDRSPQWSPDGKYLAFISQRGQSALSQVYVIALAGGEAMAVTKSETWVAAFKWSPDSASIAYTTTDAKTKEEIQAEREGRDWTVADHNYKHTRLHIIDLKTKESRLVTSQAMTLQDFDFSPDGRQFVISATDTPSVDDAFMRSRLMVISSQGGEARLLARTEGKLTSPRWSPDGKWIAWLGATAFKDPFAGSLFVVSAEGGSPENLLNGYQGTADWLSWQPGKPATVLLRSIERQANVLYSISLADKKRQTISAQAVFATGPSFSSDGRWMAVAINSPSHPNEIFFGEAANKPLKRLTAFNPQLEGVALGEQEVIRWKSVDGWEIEGVIIKPVGFKRGTRYPLVMQPHGGPEGADLNGWYGYASRWGQMLAARGFVVFYPNYRGSIGRGVDFSMADHRDLMGKEFEDMTTGIDHLVREGIVDANRVGVGGGSYGGYTSAWAATYGSEKFKAAVAWMGISNWYSMTGTSDIFLENSSVHWNAIMYDNYELYLERSPIRHIKKANTPTLIIHGAADPRVPIGQSQELYTALKWKGVPVEFVTYPREGHGVAEKAHQLDFMRRVTAWFEKYLKTEVASK
jgi:dipeptidyl aminopeptidase/acylaminoacyl peptidase